MNLWKIPNILATKPKFHFGFVLLALIVSAFALRDSTDGKRVSSSRDVDPATVHQFKPPMATGEQLLRQAAKNLAKTGPIEAAAQLHVNLFDESIVAHGGYSQLGQGRGAARLEFAFGDDEHPQSILQICNHGFFYRVKSGNGTPEVQTLDLRRLADVDKQFLFANQGTWMATGGLSGLLKNLADNFTFESVEATTLSETPVLKIRGRWKEQNLKRLLFGQIRYEIIKDDVQWEQLRGNIPQQCEILLGNDEYFPLFPYRISYFRDSGGGEERRSIETVALQLYQLQIDANVAAERFELSFDEMVRTQLTDSFVDRIQKLHQIRRSARADNLRLK